MGLLTQSWVGFSEFSCVYIEGGKTRERIIDGALPRTLRTKSMDRKENTFPLRLGDIPPEVKDRITNVISHYSVGLVILDRQDNLLHAGSGTFVLAGGRHAILTAGHVIDGVKDNYLGLALTDYEHKFILERFCLEFKSAPRGKTESVGPDLGLIYINGPKISTIKEMRSFFNLDSYVPLIGKEVDIPKMGLWMVFGFPKELYNIASHPIELVGTVYFATDHNYFERNGYDYFDFDFRSPHPGRIPPSLAGMSGGGVWHARVLYDPSTEKVHIPQDSDWLTLLGVNFYESPISDGGRDLRAHGPKSIYVKLLEVA